MDRETVILSFALLATIGALRVLKTAGKGLKILINCMVPDEPGKGEMKKGPVQKVATQNQGEGG